MAETICLYTKSGAMISIDADKLEAGLQSGNTSLKNLVTLGHFGKKKGLTDVG